jgi:hypothetical protein
LASRFRTRSCCVPTPCLNRPDPARPC